MIKDAVSELPASRETLARNLGVTGATLSRWLSGQREIPERVFDQVKQMLHDHLVRGRKVLDRMNRDQKRRTEE